VAERRVEIYLRATPDAIWRALTQPEQTKHYWYGALNQSEWTPGARWTSESAAGELYLEGELSEVEPPHRLVHTFHVVHEPAPAAEPPSRVTFEITPMGDASRLVLVHAGLEPATMQYTEGGWELILSSLKTWLETGTELHIGEPASM
jgi:uncharacterized protein YndB with AHSA1/START domain